MKIVTACVLVMALVLRKVSPHLRVLVGNEQRAGLIWSPVPVDADICAGSAGSGQDCS
jgi:hypothetical protein